MKISFIRHGCLSRIREPMTINSFHEWMKQYDSESMIQKAKMPIETIEAIEAAKFVLTSDQRRAVQSAAELTDSLSFMQNSLLEKLKFLHAFLLRSG